MKYYIYGQIADSDLEFMQLIPAPDDAEASITIRQEDIPEEILEQSKEKDYSIEKDCSWISNKTCHIVVTPPGKIAYKLKEGSGWPEYLCTYILGFGMAMLAFVQDRLAIHCSAVADDKGAVLISGESGSGKSTLTAEFLEAGYHLVADDVTCIGIGTTDSGSDEKVPLAYPAFPYQKLCRDAAIRKGYDLESLIYINEQKDKFLVPCNKDFSVEPVRIKGFIYLNTVASLSGNSDRSDEDASESGIVYDEFKGAAKIPALINNMGLRKFLGNKKYDARYVQAALEIVSRIPMGYIVRTYGEDTLDDVRNAAFGFIDKWENGNK